MTIRTIRKHLVRFNESELPSSFVAMVVALNPRKIPVHAGLLIRLNGVNYFHHFGSRPRIIENFNTSDWYVYKVINIIKVGDESEVASFLNHCKQVVNKSKITYSCIFDGSQYDSEGEFESASGLPELGTCVGFCLNTLALYVIDHDSYLNLNEWEEDSTVGFSLDNYGQEQTFDKYPSLDKKLYDSFHKRITPTEYLCAAFFDDYPVHKHQIDSIASDVLDVIDEKF